MSRANTYRHLRPVIVFAALLLCAVCGHAQITQQFVIASIGGGSQTLAGGAYYTVGEMSMIKTFAVGNQMLTQGFLQGGVPSSVGAGNTELPVRLLDFTGLYKAPADHLAWHTATEIDNDHFDVQRMDAHGNFSTSGTVKGAGNSTTEQAYSFDDMEPMPGVNYYRLKQVDIDGRFAYSEVIAVTAPMTQGMTVSIYPNPARNYVNVAFSALGAHSGTITVTDMIGTVVYQADVTLSTGTTVSQIDLSGYEPGQYIIRFTSDAVSTTSKVTKAGR